MENRLNLLEYNYGDIFTIYSPSIDLFNYPPATPILLCPELFNEGILSGIHKLLRVHIYANFSGFILGPGAYFSWCDDYKSGIPQPIPIMCNHTISPAGIHYYDIHDIFEIFTQSIPRIQFIYAVMIAQFSYCRLSLTYQRKHSSR